MTLNNTEHDHGRRALQKFMRANQTYATHFNGPIMLIFELTFQHISLQYAYQYNTWVSWIALKGN